MNNYKISMAGSVSEYESFLRESIRAVVEKLKRHHTVQSKSVHVRKAREYVSKHISQSFPRLM